MVSVLYNEIQSLRYAKLCDMISILVTHTRFQMHKCTQLFANLKWDLHRSLLEASPLPLN